MADTYRKLAEGDDPFGALPYTQLFDVLATVKAMARQHILNGDRFPINVDEFDMGIESLRRKVEANQLSMAWSDWRKAYGVTHEAEPVMRKVFAAGWAAALGETFEEGPLR